MEVMRLINHINLVTDEDFEIMEVIGFINDAIAKINVRTKANFPFIPDDLPKENMYQFEEYDAIPDTWQRMLFVPFAAGRIKENDSSQFEYLDWYQQFQVDLEEFKGSYDIPEEYLDPNAKDGIYQEDYSQNIFSPLRGW